MIGGPLRRRLERLVPWLLSAGLALVFGPAILRSSHLQGDLPGHLEMIRWSAECLWPMPWGWDPRYLGGAPIGILYPPLLAWLGGGLARLLGADDALRVLLLLSIVALPVALERAGRGFGLRRSEAVWAAVAGIAVLWLPGRGLGGSLHQTLVAGNAANAVGLPLLLMFVGRLRTAVARPGRVAGAGLWLGLTLLAHMLAGAVAGVLLVAHTIVESIRRGRGAFGRGVAIAGLGLATAAPFLVPLAVHLRESSPDGIAFSPPPTLWEGLAFGLLLLAIGVSGRPGRRALLAPLAVLTLFYLVRAVVFPLVGAPDVRMEYHRFRLYLYLAVVPAVVLAVRALPRLRRVRPVLAVAAASTVLALMVVVRYDALGPHRVPLPAELPDLAGESVLVLASPDAQAGSWHGLQEDVPSRFGVRAAKGLFVESSPLSRRVFEVERAAAGPGSRPRWWAIRIDSPEALGTWTPRMFTERCRELGIGWVLAREGVSDLVRRATVGPPLDLGAGYRLYRLPTAPLARCPGAGNAPIPATMSEDGASIRLSIPGGSGPVVVAVSSFSDWRVAAGSARLGAVSPGLLRVEGQGEIELRIAPRVEEWAGLALGLLGMIALGAIGYRERAPRVRRRRARKRSRG